MGVNNNDSALSKPQRAPEAIVAFYVTQELGLPTIIQGLGHTVMAIDFLGPSGSPIQKKALKVTFPVETSTEQPLGLIAFGTDPRCHFILPASDASEVHCKVWAQLNSGSDVWVIEDFSKLGTQVRDEQSLRSGKPELVHGRRRASKGLRTIMIGSCTFSFLAPVSKSEIRDREDWFRCNPPIAVTKAMLDGQLGNDRYDLCRMSLNPIGKGAYGEVYKYMEKNTALLVAIKEQCPKNEDQKRMAIKEINFMKRLHHPYLIDLLFNDSDNKPLPRFMTGMPLCLGHLRSILPLPDVPKTERLMLQIAEGLGFMHSNLILHRDLKPDNILVASSTSIKIADYGWATSLKDTHTLYGVCGTIAYCAPEAFKLHEIHTPAIDVYSLGAVFYEMLDLDKVERGWVARDFEGGKELFNSTFENAFKSPPHIYAGLVQSMLAQDPKTRCSLDETIEVVNARNHGWTRKTPLMPTATEAHPATAQFGTRNTKILLQTPFGRNGKKAKMPKPNPFTQDKIPELHEHLQHAPTKYNDNRCWPALERQGPRAPMQKPRSKPAHVQGVNFNAGLPSYAEATGQNPFAPRVKGGKNRNPHRDLNGTDKHLRHRTKEPPVPRASIAAAHPIHRRQHALNLHRAREVGVHKRRDRQAARYERLAELKKGAYHVAKGCYIFTRALLGLACEELVDGGERIYDHLKDNKAAREALQHANVNADKMLVASLQRHHSLRAVAKSRRIGGGGGGAHIGGGDGRRSSSIYSDDEMLSRQLMPR